MNSIGALLGRIPQETLGRVMGRLSEQRVPPALLAPIVHAYSKLYRVDLDEAQQPDGGYASFDAFFTRSLKAGLRPIDANLETFVSPSDGRLEAFGPINPNGLLSIKGSDYTLQELLGTQDGLQPFDGGLYGVVYLHPRDYHRVHAPVDCRVSAWNHISGERFPVNALGVRFVPKLFSRNERVVVHAHSARFGEFAVVMVGAAGVGRLELAFADIALGRASYGESGPTLARGEELGTFHLGSTVIFFTSAAAGLQAMAPLGERVRMGQALARRKDV